MSYKIDAIDLLEEVGVDYRTEGTNVAANDVNIDCPFCGDSRKHLGIHKEDGRINCWACGLEDIKPRPTLTDLVMELVGCSKIEASMLIKGCRLGSVYSDSRPAADRPKPPDEVWVPDVLDLVGQSAQQRRAYLYLRRRGFDHKTARKYDLKICLTGRYSGRIIVPISHKGELVSWLGRDYTGCSSLRYKNCPSSLCKMRNKELLYNYDNVINGGGDHLRVVEGVTDVWAMNDSQTVAQLTNKLSPEQIRLIVSDIRPRSLTLLPDGDPDSLMHANRAAELLFPVISEIRVINLAGKDVAERGRREMLRLEEKASPIS